MPIKYTGDDGKTETVNINTPRGYYLYNKQRGKVPQGTNKTYWDNPARIARYYWLKKSLPEGQASPDWMPANLDQTYNHLLNKNGGKPWYMWDELDEKDPIVPEVRSWQAPPDYAQQVASQFSSPGRTDWRPLEMIDVQDKAAAQQFDANGKPLEVDAQGNPIAQYQPGQLPDQSNNPFGYDAGTWDQMEWYKKIANYAFGTGAGQIAAGVAQGAVPGAIAGGLPGGIIGGAIGGIAGGLNTIEQKRMERMGANYKPGIAGGLMQGLDFAFRQSNNLLGFITQIGMSIDAPERYGDLLDLFKNIDVNWNAGQAFYASMGVKGEYSGGAVTGERIYGPQEMTGFERMMKPADKEYYEKRRQELQTKGGYFEYDPMDQPGQVRVQLPPGMNPTEYGIMEARDMLKSGMTTMEVQNALFELYGLGGQAADLIAGLALDPLNKAPDINRAGFRTAAKLGGNATLDLAAQMSSGPIDTLKNYGSLLRTKALPETPTNVELGKMDGFTRWLAGVDKEGNPSLTNLGTGKPLDPRTWFGLTPKARADEYLASAATNLQLALQEADTPEGMMSITAALGNVDIQAASDLTKKLPWTQSPEGAALPMALRDFISMDDLNPASSKPVSTPGGNMLDVYHKYDWQRNLINRIAADLELDPNAVMQKIATGEGDAILKQEMGILTQRMGAGDQAATKWLAAINDSRKPLTAKVLEGMVDNFKTGVAFGPEEFRAQLYAALLDHADAWAAKYFKVKPDPVFIRLSAAVKATQSAFLLGLNPGYLMNNAINNVVTMAWGGVFGLRTPDQIGRFWDGMGVTPARLRAGVGISAMGENIELGKAVRAAGTDGGMLQKWANTMQSGWRKKMQFAQTASAKMEQWSSAQAYTAGTMQAMNRLMVAGVGYDKLPAVLAQQLDSITPGLSMAVESAIAGSGGDVKLLDQIWDGAERITLEQSIPDVIENLKAQGIDIDTGGVRDVLQAVGVYDFLRTELPKAKDNAAVQSTFAIANETLRRKLDEMGRVHFATEAERQTIKAKAEGAAGALETFDTLHQDIQDFWLKHFVDLETVFSEAEGMTSVQRDAVIRAQLDAADQEWARIKDMEGAKMAGIFRGLGGNDANVIALDRNMLNARDVWGNFYAERRRMWDEYFNGNYKDKAERAAAKLQTEVALDNLYGECLKAEEALQADTDAIFAELFGKQFFGNGGAAAAWRKGVRDIRSQMGNDMRAFRKTLQNLAPAEKRAAWGTFLKDTYEPRIKELTAANLEKARGMYNIISGGPSTTGNPTRIIRHTIAELRTKLALVGIGNDVQWNAQYKKLNQHLDAGDPPFTEMDYNTTPSPEWMARLDKATARLAEVEGQPQAAPRPTMPEVAQEVAAQVAAREKVKWYAGQNGVQEVDGDQIRGTLRQAWLDAGYSQRDVDDVLIMMDAKAKLQAGRDGKTVAQWWADSWAGGTLDLPDFGDPAFQTMFQNATKADIDTPEFRKFFGNSAVVDENGNPRVVYHGTNAPDFDVFDVNKIGSTTGNYGHAGKGFYFSAVENYAGSYATPFYGGDNPRVMPVYLSIKKPFTFDASIRADRLALLDLAKKAGIPFEFPRDMDISLYRLWQTYGGESIRKMFEDAGYDGVIVGRGENFGDEIVAFSPEQIKSVYNNGDFDPNNPNIYFQTAPVKGTPEYAAFMDGNAIIGPNGEPLHVYHGTGDASFDDFNTKFDTGKNLLGRGVYLTDDVEIARTYAFSHNAGKPGLYETIVRMVKPLDLRDSNAVGRFAGEIYDLIANDQGYKYGLYGAEYYRVMGQLNGILYGAFNPSQEALLKNVFQMNGQIINRIARDLDYDGIIFKGTQYTESTGKTPNVYVVFDGEQIANVKVDTLFQSANKTDTPEFKQWFGASKIVDENGAPLVAYHGTNADFSEFNYGKLGKSSLGGAGTDYGFFFAAEKEHADYWALNAVANYGGEENVMPVYLKIEKPAIIDATDSETASYLSDLLREAYEGDHDGAIVKIIGDDNTGETRTMYIVFAKEGDERIKSVNNIGTFDPANPNIYHQRNAAATTFLPDGRAVFSALGTSRNITQLVHEVGHVFRRQLPAGDVNGYIKYLKREYDIDVTYDAQTGRFGGEATIGAEKAPWLEQGGTLDTGTWAEEVFARGFERYLREGRAPTANLRNIFKRMRDWMMEIYRQIKGSDVDVKMTDELRSIFDRMFTEKADKRFSGKYIDDLIADYKGDKARLYKDIFQKYRTKAEAVAAAKQFETTQRPSANPYGDTVDWSVYQEALDDIDAHPELDPFAGRPAEPTREETITKLNKGLDGPRETIGERMNLPQSVANEINESIKIYAQQLQGLLPSSDSAVVTMRNADGEAVGRTSQNPEWYQKMYERYQKSGRSLNRKSVENALQRIIDGDDTIKANDKTILSVKDAIWDFMLAELSNAKPEGVNLVEQLILEPLPRDYVAQGKMLEAAKQVQKWMMTSVASELDDAAWAQLVGDTDTFSKLLDYDIEADLPGDVSAQAIADVQSGKPVDVDTAARVGDKAMVLRLAQEFGIPTATKAGKPMDKAALNIINKRQPEGQKYNSLSEVPADVAEQAFRDHKAKYEVVEPQPIEVEPVAQVEEATPMAQEAPAPLPELPKKAEPTFAKMKSGQTTMFGAGEDTPLFSGTPMTAKQETFTPKEAGGQDALFATGEYLQNIEPKQGGDESGLFANTDTLFQSTRGGKIVTESIQPDTHGGMKIVANVYRVVGEQRELIAYLPEAFSTAQWQDSSSGRFHIIGLDVQNPNKWLIEFADGHTDTLDRAAEPTAAINAPVGTLDQIDPNAPVTEAMFEASRTQVKPILNALQRRMTRPDATTPQSIRGARVDADTRQQVSAHLAKVKGQMSSAKLAAIRIGETKRDFALLNYNRRTNIDTYLTALLPYQFWGTRTMMNWAQRFIDRPAILSNYARLQMMRDRNERKGIPTRLKGKVVIPMPFMPNEFGDYLYIDPQRQLFPWENFYRPLAMLSSNKNMVEKRATQIVSDWIEAETISSVKGTAALQKSGPDWERAVAQANQELADDLDKPYDIMSSLFSPAKPVTDAYYALTGQKDKIGKLPFTRLIEGLTGLAGNAIDLEGPVRKGLGIDNAEGVGAFESSWQDWEIDRALSNMVGDGTITADEAITAMIDRKGEAYDTATTRIGKERGIRQLLPGLFADLYPEGEKNQRQLAAEFSKSINAKKAGDTDAVTKFFEAHPDYEARLASFKEPEDRLRNFLIGKVWDQYNTLGKVEKQAMSEGLGDLFTDAFISKETRSYDAIDTDTLASWVKTMGGQTPETAKGVTMPVNMPDAKTIEASEAFYEERDNRFPGIAEKLSAYYESDNKVVDDQLQAYFQWKNRKFAENPDLIKYMTSDENELAGLPQDIQQYVYAYRTAKDEQFPDIYDVQERYFAISDAQQKKAYRANHPELEQYWAFRKDYAANFPKAAAYILSDESLSGYIRGNTYSTSTGTEAGYATYDKPENYRAPFLTPAEIAKFEPGLVRQLYAYLYGGGTLGVGAKRELRQLKTDFGIAGDLDEFIDLYVKPAIVR